MGFHLSLITTDIQCPQCEYNYSESFYYEAMRRSKNGLIYKTCKICKNKLGITSSMRGDIVVWLKKDEKK